MKEICPLLIVKMLKESFVSTEKRVELRMVTDNREKLHQIGYFPLAKRVVAGGKNE